MRCANAAREARLLDASAVPADAHCGTATAARSTPACSALAPPRLSTRSQPRSNRNQAQYLKFQKRHRTQEYTAVCTRVGWTLSCTPLNGSGCVDRRRCRCTRAVAARLAGTSDDRTRDNLITILICAARRDWPPAASLAVRFAPQRRTAEARGANAVAEACSAVAVSGRGAPQALRSDARGVVR